MLRRFSRLQLRGISAALLVSLVGAGMSAQAGLASLEAAEQQARAVTPKASGYEADDHFPGAAYYHLAADETAFAAPAAGATGTVELPDAPVPENAVLDPTLRPAPPFVLRGSAQDKARALECLTTAIYYEAATEPDDGQRAVAQVILNRARHPTFPSTVCGVVYQGSDKTVCQFSFACDGSMARIPSRAHWQRAARVAAAALSGAVFAPVGMATHYHTYAVTPSWNASLVMTGVFGAHFFHRWKGYWGTGAAFRQVYAGGEPYPGPLPRAATATPMLAVAPDVALPSPPGRHARSPRRCSATMSRAATCCPNMPPRRTRRSSIAGRTAASRSAETRNGPRPEGGGRHHVAVRSAQRRRSQSRRSQRMRCASRSKRWSRSRRSPWVRPGAERR